MKSLTYVIQSIAYPSQYWTKSNQFGPRADAKTFATFVRAYNHAERSIPVRSFLWRIIESNEATK